MHVFFWKTPDFPIWPINTIRIPASRIKLILVFHLKEHNQSSSPGKIRFLYPLLQLLHLATHFCAPFSAWSWAYTVTRQSLPFCLCHPHFIASSTYPNFAVILLLWGEVSWNMEKAMAPHSSTLAWKIPWTEEPGRLQSMGSHRVGHGWSNLAAAAAVMKYEKINGYCISCSIPVMFMLWTAILELFNI